MSKEKAIIYCRVSTNKQSQEGESLAQQAQACEDLARKFDCQIVNTFSETFSGKRIENRPELNLLFQYIKKNSVDYVFIRDIDRLTRGGGKDYTSIKDTLTSRGVELVDSYGFIQPATNMLDEYDIDCEYDWSRISPTSTAEKMRADMSEEERNTILRRLIPAQIRLIQEGYHIARPNDGYINKQIFIEGKQKFVLELDPDRSKYFTEMFEMRINGYTDKEIVKRINKMGFLTKRRRRWNTNHTNIIGHTGGNKLNVKQLQKYICNTKYAGVNIHKWTKYKPIRTKGANIVTIDMFNRANKGKVYIKENIDNSLDILYNDNPLKNTKRRMKHNPAFPIKTLVLCDCLKPFKGSSSTGKSGNKFAYYHCERGHKGVRIRREKLENKYDELLRKISFSNANNDALTSAIHNVWESHVKQYNLRSERLQCEIDDVKAKKNRVIQKLITTDSETVMKALETELETLETSTNDLEKDRKKEMLSEGNINDFLLFATKLVEHPDKMLAMTDDIEIKEALSSIYFEETPTYLDVFSGTPRMSVIYKLCESSHNDKSLNVARRGIEPLFPE